MQCRDFAGQASTHWCQKRSNLVPIFCLAIKARSRLAALRSGGTRAIKVRLRKGGFRGIETLLEARFIMNFSLKLTPTGTAPCPYSIVGNGEPVYFHKFDRPIRSGYTKNRRDWGLANIASGQLCDNFRCVKRTHRFTHRVSRL